MAMDRFGWLIGIAAILLAGGSAPVPLRPGGEPDVEAHDHGEVIAAEPTRLAVPIDGAEAVSFPAATTDPRAQAFINQGVALLHARAFEEASRSFRQAARLDPRCPIAFWGMAASAIRDEPRATTFIRGALYLKDHERLVSVREAMYINALDAYLEAGAARDRERREEYALALEAIACDFPDDAEARAFLAEQLADNLQAGLPVAGLLAVDALFRGVLDSRPDHPSRLGRMLLWEHDRPEQALAAAGRFESSMPGVSTLWHRSGHVLERLGRFDQAIRHYEAAARVDLAALVGSGRLPDQAPGLAHNRECLARALARVGRVREATDLAAEMVDWPRHPRDKAPSGPGRSVGRGRRLLVDILTDYELWDELAARSEASDLDPAADPIEQVHRLRALGRADFGRGDVDRGRERLSTLEGSAPVAGSDPADSRARARAIDELRGRAALASGEPSEGLRLLERAENLDPLETARVLAIARRADEAENALNDLAERRKGEVPPLAALVELRWRADRKREAEQAFQRLREAAAGADLNVPTLARLAPIAAALGYPRDWRFPRSGRGGDGSALNPPGPARWRPEAAPPWALQKGSGGKISLDDYRGKPLVLIFYLGSGCLHCVQQLDEFASKAEAFEAAGLAIAGVSIETPEALKKLLDAYGGPFPFPLVSDADLATFRAYHAFDEFAGSPLHGTFLIDGGRILWADIGREPFLEADFLLAEARRLLTVYRPAAK